MIRNAESGKSQRKPHIKQFRQLLLQSKVRPRVHHDLSYEFNECCVGRSVGRCDGSDNLSLMYCVLLIAIINVVKNIIPTTII